MNKPLPREWIGKPVHFRGKPYTVHEVIDADSQQPQLILQSADKEIQADQWGDAHRRVPETITVALYSQNDDEDRADAARRINPELELSPESSQ
ncbi:MAG: hypothetical protein R3352_09710 [Salinisphaeraceae bacterium]|nr:hypothetical protein [Salinisphaeraceae bacterium]